MRRYTVQPGDTLAKIAFNSYGAAELSLALAGYNGILDPNRILVGQTIEIPSKTELLRGRTTPPIHDTDLPVPHGLDQIIATFGNIGDFISADGTPNPQWESTFLSRVRLPFAIPLSGKRTQEVTNLYCHVKLIDILPEALAELERRGLRNRILAYGGCFNFRTKRTGNKFSTHCWGIAIDLNPETNLQGTKGNMDPGVVEVFREYGFKWGGDWPGRSKDPMHFQYCTGY